MNALARLLAALDGLTLAVDRVAERLNTSDTVPASDVDNAAARVEDQNQRLAALLDGSNGGGSTSPVSRHK